MKKIRCYILGCCGYVNWFPKPYTFSQTCIRCGTIREWKIPQPKKN